MKPVAADVPLLGDISVDGIRGSRGWQVVKERGVEHRDVRQVRQHLAGHADAEHCGRIVQRREGRQLVQLFDQSVVDRSGPVEVRAAVHHAMPHRDQPDGVQARAGLGEQLERGAQRRLVIGDRGVAAHLPLPDGQRRRRGILADPLDDAVGQRCARIGLDQLKFHRRRTRVEHQDRARAHRLPWAWIAVMATVLTISSTSAPRDRSLTGWFSPCNTGPMAIAPALRCTAL